MLSIDQKWPVWTHLFLLCSSLYTVYILPSLDEIAPRLKKSSGSQVEPCCNCKSLNEDGPPVQSSVKRLRLTCIPRFHVEVIKG